MVNGVGLRLPSLRGSWVQIPPPALRPRSLILRNSWWREFERSAADLAYSPSTEAAVPAASPSTLSLSRTKSTLTSSACVGMSDAICFSSVL